MYHHRRGLLKSVSTYGSRKGVKTERTYNKVLLYFTTHISNRNPQLKDHLAIADKQVYVAVLLVIFSSEYPPLPKNLRMVYTKNPIGSKAWFTN